ncbi:porin family protein [Pseudozobellia thermophila]|uniref:Outer membrane protein beta-barrel domain-containing protein n=1 Tax=Pseudozobellia thermophila TaxID=192903 RepID=A0A1M6CJW5_9FLAO|nr:porin family protein [Pseudozobellia thermophila]SHI61320.1 Outer membrane protein beta-barrel domain-containing protein [Pseudozobellia thermophila]
MYKFTILLFLTLLCSTSSFSQNKASFGFRAGLNSSKITNTSLHSKQGIYAGALIDVRFTERYALQPELVYSNQGGRSKGNSDNDLRINYITVGVANKVFVDDHHRFHLIFGPSLDFNFDDNFVNLVNDTGTSKATFFDLALFGGLGYEFDSGLIIEGRFKQGLINVDLFNEDFNSEFYDNKGATLNALFQFGLAYKF